MSESPRVLSVRMADGTHIEARASWIARDGWRWQGGHRPRRSGRACRSKATALLSWLARYAPDLETTERVRLHAVAQAMLALERAGAAAAAMPDAVGGARSARCAPAAPRGQSVALSYWRAGEALTHVSRDA